MSKQQEEVWINPYCSCPKCKSHEVDERDYDNYMEYFKCHNCATWYNEVGEIDNE